MKRPTLSVIMPNYNHAHFLPEAIQSILDQSYQPMEWIIIDDASTDNSLEILEEFAQKCPIIRLVHNERNMGVIYNLNRLLELASGDYVVGLAADDIFLPGFFEKSMTLLEQYPQAGFCSTPSRLIDEAGKDTGLAPLPIIAQKACFLSPEACLQVLCQHGAWFPGNTSIYRRQVLLDAGGFIPELHSFADGFIYQVIALKHGACFIPEPLGAWRRMAGGYASQSMFNVNLSLEIMQHAETLMRSTYQELFPPDYIALWKRHWLYTTNVYALQRLQGQQQTYLADYHRLVAPLSVLDKLFLLIVQGLMRIQYIIMRLYLFLRMRRKTWEVVTRWLVGQRRTSWL